MPAAALLLGIAFCIWAALSEGSNTSSTVILNSNGTSSGKSTSNSTSSGKRTSNSGNSGNSGNNSTCPTNATILVGTDLICHNSSRYPVWCDDLMQIPCADPDACCALCAANASAGGSCQSFSFNFEHSLCYLKRRQGRPANSTDTSGHLFLISSSYAY
jgi:hypothetical protein